MHRFPTSCNVRGPGTTLLPSHLRKGGGWEGQGVPAPLNHWVGGWGRWGYAQGAMADTVGCWVSAPPPTPTNRHSRGCSRNSLEINKYLSSPPRALTHFSTFFSPPPRCYCGGVKIISFFPPLSFIRVLLRSWHTGWGFETAKWSESGGWLGVLWSAAAVSKKAIFQLCTFPIWPWYFERVQGPRICFFFSQKNNKKWKAFSIALVWTKPKPQGESIENKNMYSQLKNTYIYDYVNNG